MAILTFSICVIFLSISIVSLGANGQNDGSSNNPTQATILVNFMADLVTGKVKSPVTAKWNGKTYGGRYYWLGNRYYTATASNVTLCQFQTPDSFPFSYKDGTKVTEIVYQCNATTVCCEAACCEPTTVAPVPVTDQAQTVQGQTGAPAAPAETGATTAATTAPTAAPSSGGGGLSMASLIGIGVAVVLIIACLCTLGCCLCCRRRGKGRKGRRGGAPPKKGPTLKPGYGTMAKFALKSKFGG